LAGAALRRRDYRQLPRLLRLAPQLRRGRGPRCARPRRLRRARAVLADRRRQPRGAGRDARVRRRPVPRARARELPRSPWRAHAAAGRDRRLPRRRPVAGPAVQIRVGALMDIRLDTVGIAVDGDSVSGTMLAPARQWPGILFVHGWGGNQAHDLVRAREAAGLGSVCLTFDLRGHEANASQWETVSRAQNLDDLLATYDWLAQHPIVDDQSMVVVGISYGGYLAAILSALRPVRWLALRSPALYPDEGWDLPKRQLHRDFDLASYRRRHVPAGENRALRACQAFRGDALLVEAEH